MLKLIQKDNRLFPPPAIAADKILESGIVLEKRIPGILTSRVIFPKALIQPLKELLFAIAL